MTELEKIAYAKSFIDKLASGINPLDNSKVPDGDIVNNARLSKCFSYVSDILGQVYENGGIGKVEKTIPFSITPAQLARFEASPYSLSGSELSKRVTSLVNNPIMKAFSVIKLNHWLMQKGYLYEFSDSNGKSRKVPTEQGKNLGIRSEHKMGREGEYIAVTYDSAAQRFIIDHIYEILQ